MEQLSYNAKRLILDQMKEQLINHINHMTVDDLRVEEINETFLKGIRVGLIVRNENIFSNDDYFILSSI